jgi:hypothetical protein
MTLEPLFMRSPLRFDSFPIESTSVAVMSGSSGKKPLDPVATTGPRVPHRMINNFKPLEIASSQFQH